MSALRELLASFHIDFHHEELEKGEKGVEHLIESFKKAGEALLAAFAVEKIHEFIDAQIENAAQLKISAERLGIETQELQALQFAAGQAGVSNEALTTSLRFLNRNIAEAIEKGGEQATTFAKLHIALKNADGSTRSAGDVMGEFADAVASINDPARQTQIAMQLLGRGGAELIPLLKQGSAAFEAARKQVAELGGGLSDEFIERAHKAEQEQKKLTFAMTGFKSEIATAVLPALETMLTAGIRMVVNLRDLAQHTDVLTHALRAAVGIAIAMAPGITAIAAGAAILYLSFDELYTLLRGGDTVIGDALGADKVKFVTDLRDAVDDLFGSTEELDGASKKTTDSWGALKTILVDVAKLLAGIVESVSWVVRVVEQLNLLQNAQKSGVEGERAAQLFQARKADLASGLGHEHEDELKKTWADQARLGEQAGRPRQTAEDKENALAGFAREFEQSHSAWEAGGKHGYEPQATASVVEYIQRHPEIAAPAVAAGKGGKGGNVIHQILNVHNELHPSSSTDEATAIGQLTDQTSKGVERANERAYTASNVP